MSALRAEIEDFLYAEANLLDEWRLDEWFALFTDDAVYEIPTAGMPDSASAAVSLFYVADDHTRLRERVIRLNDPDAHSEQPRSLVRRIYGNMRLEQDGDHVIAHCTFMAKRAKNRRVDDFFGHIVFRLVRAGANWKIAAKRVYLDMDLLHPGKISIIL
jgi:p-cumate 2,3-dioxygenase subunit beta